MRLAKSIDELYEEVKDYDLVLCNDAPLALALNNRLDRPRLGAFAVTPMQLAGSMCMDILGRPTLNDIEVVKRVSKTTGYKLKYVHGEIENYKKIRRYTPRVREHLGKKSRNVYDEYIQLPTLELAMGTFDGENAPIFKGKKIAVIGEGLYNDLDKHFNPKLGTYESINPFKRGRFDIDEIRELSNNREIAENAVDLITPENSFDVAIVMDVNGAIADSVRSALYRKRIPFINSLSVRDLSNVRGFLEFLRLANTFETVKISQVRELISSYGGFIQGRYDQYLACNFSTHCDNERAKEILDIMRDIESMTYLEVCDRVARAEGAQIKILLSELELNDEYVNAKDTEDIIYAVNNINDLKHNEQIPETEKEGVLLVDCKNSVWIDRPIVIYLGMGTEWDMDLSDLNLVDRKLKDEENDKNLEKFQILLQQGSQRIYICNSTKGGKRPKPCSLFDQCIDSDTAETFDSVCNRIVKGNWYEPEGELKIERGSVSLEDPDYIPKPFSKSSFDNFISCPREYMFGVFLGSPDKSSTVIGNLLHEYAEFRTCHPEIVEEKGIEHYVDRIANDSVGLLPSEVRSLTKSNIRNSIININRFIDREGFSDRVIPGKRTDKKSENRFFAECGLEGGTNMNEIEYVSMKGHMKGIFDIIDDERIFDLKTGKAMEAKKIKDAMNDKKSDYNKEYQCMFYLSLLGEISDSKDNSFTLFYTAGNERKSAKGDDFDISENMCTVRLIGSKEDYFRNIYMERLLEMKSYEYLKKVRSELEDAVLAVGFDNPDGLDASNDFLDAITRAKNWKKESTLQEAYEKLKSKFKKDLFGDTNDVFVEGKHTLFVTDEYFARFKKLISDSYERLKHMYNTNFPADPKIECCNCYFKDICTRNSEAE